jgi:prolyl 4-hydroxylase
MDGKTNIDFIFEGKIKKSVCKELIDFYESGKNAWISKTEGGVGINKVNHKLKKCTESYYNPDQINDSFLKELGKNLKQYKKLYKYSDDGQYKWGLREYIKIQKYQPGEGYFSYHYEVCGRPGITSKRFLVFMAYLNTVKKGGETEFVYQNKKFKPVEGKLLIWPAYWTHTHRGIPALKETKYIITGWWNYDD